MEVVRPQPRERNPGPTWGYRLLFFSDTVLPQAVVNCALYAGASVAVTCMPEQRKASADYLQLVLKHRPARRDINRHFYTFTRSLMAKLRVARGLKPDFRYADTAASQPFHALCTSGELALFGTFHVGQSDLLGCMLSEFDRDIALVRHRVGNSLDTDFMARTFSPRVRFLWVNQPENLLFELKNAIEQNLSIGLQCDRVEYGGRLEAFSFLGKQRLFPVTIYHLARLFRRPVAFAFAGSEQRSGRIPVVTSSVFKPADHNDPQSAAREHFQEVLSALETHLLENPYLWFNFKGLNPEAAS